VNHDELTLLLDYHYWARDRMLAAVESLAAEKYTQMLVSSFRSVRDTVVHMYAAEWVWNRRWHGESPTELIPGVRFADVEAIRHAWTELEHEVRGDLARLDDDGLKAVVHYRLFSGVEAATPFWQILQHVVNHASYHRGQVTTLLRQLGAAPPESIDLITFYRTGSR
jgi:uncharacterized damage-inducible protein DinB